MTILSIGRSSFDITCPVDEYPIEGTKYILNEKIESGGGTAANVAYMLAKWGETSYFAGVVGSDDYGTKIRKELEQVMVKMDMVENSYEYGTPVSVILVNKKNGSRTRFDVVGATQPSIKKFDYTFTPDVIFTDGKEYAGTINAFNKFPKAITVLDAGRVDRDLLELCKYVKYIVCSKGFAETVAKERFDFDDNNSLKSIYETLENKFKCNIIVTLEEKGCLYKIDGKIKVMTGLKVNAKDTTGAGDIFHGAFIYGLSKQLPLEKCLKIANITAGLSVKKIGSRLSIPDVEEVYKVYDKNR